MNGSSLVLAYDNSHDPHQKFILFKELLRELRIMIWEWAILGTESRTFTITNKHESECKEPFWRLPPRVSSKPYSSHSKVPTLLHTTREARATALISYQLSLDNEFASKPVYFNFMRDTFILESTVVMMFFSRMNQESIASIYLWGNAEDLQKALPNELSRLEKKIRHVVVNYGLLGSVGKLLLRYRSLQMLVFRELYGDSAMNRVDEAAFSKAWREAALKKGYSQAKMPSFEGLEFEPFHERFDIY
jgi:hypothetical protein